MTTPIDTCMLYLFFITLVGLSGYFCVIASDYYTGQQRRKEYRGLKNETK